jgi:hypothetical protein
MPPFVRSVTVIVCVPTVLSVTLICAVPPARTRVTGVLAAASVDVRRTLSALETGFHHASVAFTVIANAWPELCAAGVPVLPLPPPGSAVSPGASSCRRESAAGCTTNGSLVPFLPGAVDSHA